MRCTRSASRVLILAGLLAGTATLLPAALRAQAMLRPGSEARGELKSGDLRLDDNTYADLWRFSGTSGQRVRITMRSDAFDAYLSVGWIDDSGHLHDWQDYAGKLVTERVRALVIFGSSSIGEAKRTGVIAPRASKVMSLFMASEVWLRDQFTSIES